MKQILLFCVLCFILGCSSGQRRNENNNNINNNSVRPQNITKPSVNVYIENSASMDGYVKGITEFEEAVYGYLSDIKISDFTNSLNLFYINSEVIKQGSDIDDFIHKLEPSTFRQKGGKRGVSDLSNVLKSVLNETDKNEIAILITDGIFSPGKGKNAQEYLVNQQIGIKNSTAEYLKKCPNSGIIIYQMSSKFNGNYYNNTDNPITLNNVQRPYYIWIIGDASKLAVLQQQVPENKIKGGGVKHMFSITHMNQNIDYSIKQNSGDFDISRTNPKYEIIDLSSDSRYGKVRFAVNANFNNLLLNDDYLLNSDNYIVTDYQLIVKKNDVSSKYTHSLNFTADKVRNGELLIKLKSKVPKWVEEVNDNSGISAITGKTYGIKYQINGVYEAFTNKTDNLTEIKITIK